MTKPPPAKKAAVAPAAAKPARAANPSPCPVEGCAKVCKDRTGLSAHMRVVHGAAKGTVGIAPRPTNAAAAPSPSSSEPESRKLPGGKVFRCADCAIEKATIPGLIEHVLAAHHREVKPLERTPRLTDQRSRLTW